MSVINKVLRDLDRRAPQAPASEGSATGGAALTRGTSSVQAVPSAADRKWPWRVALSGVALLMALVLWWWLDRRVVPPPVPGGTAVEVAPATAAHAVLPGVSGAVAGAAPAAVPVVAASAPSPLSDAPRAPEATVASAPAFSMLLPAPAAAGPRVATAPQAPGQWVQGTEPVPVAGDLQARPTALPATPELPRARARVEGASTDPAAAVPAWPELALEALAQAQRTWNTGARDAAIDFLGEALAGVERVHAAEWAAGGPAGQAPLAMVRELARMQTVQGQHAVVLALLRRHERLLSGQADLWAMRGGAAQRLAQHVEASQSYLVALKLRAGEPRWMLGAAVSLAAMGQTGSAAELAEQARAIGPVSPEVLAYLRQLGVVLRER